MSKNNFSNPRINQSVGLGGQNKPSDTFVIQRLLNECKTDFTGRGSVVPDGNIGSKSIKAIKAFQKMVVKMTNADGRVDPNGKSFKKLLSERAPKFIALNNKIAAQNQMTTITTDLFIKLYKKEFKGQVLSPTATSGLKYLISKINEDKEIIDIRWAAYMLATVKHECANKYQPINEIGKGNYFSKTENKQVVKDYSKVIKVLDPSTNKTRDNVYYGRGYVQLTWEDNYKFIGNKIGLGNKLHINPDLALVPENAYKIMSYGMRNGSFTNKELKQYLIGSYTDYKGARKIINGRDKDVLIAEYARKFEILLKLSESTYLTFMKTNFNIFNWKIILNHSSAPSFAKTLMKY